LPDCPPAHNANKVNREMTFDYSKLDLRLFYCSRIDVRA
jgi:hypothetical protein